MQVDGIMFMLITMVCVLQECTFLGVIQESKMIHDYIIRNGFESHVTVENYLVVLYTKCERMEIMHLIFHRMYKIIILS